jgi:hypothetical protein
LAGKTGLEVDKEKSKHTMSRHQRAGEYPNIDTANKPSVKVAEFKYRIWEQLTNSNCVQEKLKSILNLDNMTFVSETFIAASCI